MDLFFSELLKERGPLYQQIYSLIANYIITGRLKAGDRLPSKRALSTQLGVSVITIQGAYDMLCDEGYIISRPRSGFYVQKVDTPKMAIQVLEKPVHIEKSEYKYDFRMNAVDRNSFPYKTWGRLMRETILDGQDLLRRSDARGDSVLRESLAQHLEQLRGVKCSPRQIFIGAGIEYLQMLLCRIFDGYMFALEDPCYPKLRKVLENDNRLYENIPLDKNGIMIDKLEESCAEIVCITPSHQFPTGVEMPIGQRSRLLKWACGGNKRRYIIEDDFGGEFDLDGIPARCMQGLDTNGRVIYMGSFSRILAPTIRIAYMILPFPLLEITQERFSAYSSTVSFFEQRALSRFINEGYMLQHIRRTKNVLRRRRELLFELICTIPEDRRPAIDLHTVSSHAVLYLKKGDALSFIHKANLCGVRVYNMADFYKNKKDTPKNCIVLGISDISETQIKEAFCCIRDLFV